MGNGHGAWAKVLTAKQTGGHSFYAAGIASDPSLIDGRLSNACVVAVADGSIRDTRDPSTTDDGLCLVDVARVRAEGLTIKASRSHGEPIAIVPLTGRGQHFGACAKEAVALAKLLGCKVEMEVGGVRWVPQAS
jgi:hypothetical protein